MKSAWGWGDIYYARHDYDNESRPYPARDRDGAMERPLSFGARGYSTYWRFKRRENLYAVAYLRWARGKAVIRLGLQRYEADLPPEFDAAMTAGQLVTELLRSTQ